MAKNMTRKALAIGSGSALVASLFAAAPAYANDSVVTELADGSSFNTVVGEENGLTVKTTMSPGLTSNDGTLHYRVSNPSGADLQLGIDDTNSAVYSGARTNVVDSGTDDGEVWEYGESAENTSDSNGTVGDFQTDLTDFVVVPSGNAVGDAANNNWLYIGVVDADVDVTVTVTAWLDTAAGATNLQDSTEISGNTVELNFYDQANISATTTMVTPVTGAASVSATTVTSPELNGDQLGADFIDVAFTAQGNSNAVLAENTSSNAAVSATMGTTTYSDVTDTWTSTAYLKYSDAADAWNGTDSTVSGTVDLAAATAATIAVAAGPGEATVDGKATGLGASNSGSFVVTIDDLDTAAQSGGSSAVAANTDVVARPVSISAADVFKFTPSPTTGFTAGTAFAITGGTAKFYSVGTNATVQAEGVYSATPYIGTTKLGAVGSSAVSPVTADDTKAFILPSENVAQGYNENGGSADTVEVRTGTTSVTATATVYYTDSDDFDRIKVAPAGVPVVGSITANSGTFQINSSGAGVTSDTVLTDANGQVSFTVTTTTEESAANSVDLNIAPQSIAAGAGGAAKFVLVWDDESYTIYDMNHTGNQPGSDADSYRAINTGGSYTYSFAVLDQWGSAIDDDDYRLQVINQGRTVSSDYHTLSNGRVSVIVADGGQGSGSTITSTVNLQKDVTGTWTNQTTESWDGTGFGQVVINVADGDTETITLESGSSFASSLNNKAVDLDDNIAPVATSEQNRRLSPTIPSNSTNAVVVEGRVTDKLTGLSKGGQDVTITGDSSILFSYGDIDSLGSIVIPSDAEGDFAVEAYSNKIQTDTVLTLTTPNGGLETVKVSFGDVTNALTGTEWTWETAGAEPGQTLVITGTLLDKWGNPIDSNQGTSTLGTDEAEVEVTYDGPGLISTNLPTETNKNGQIVVRILLGSNDTGTATLSATYGAAGDGAIDVTDTGVSIDVTGAVSVTVGPEEVEYGTVSAWTVDQGDGTAKVYVKFPTIGEKVRIGHQTGGSGSYETIYVKTTSSETMDGLRIVEGVGTYIVRTIDLESGTNRIRVDVGDSREVQVRYNQ